MRIRKTTKIKKGRHTYIAIPDSNLSLETKSFSKPKCKLVGTDGNIFALVGKASKTLKGAGLFEKAKEMMQEVFKSKSYDDALCIIMKYVEIE